MKKTLITRRTACSSVMSASSALMTANAQDHSKPAAAKLPTARPVPVSPDIAPDGRIAFRLFAPNSTDVSLLGDWPGGARIPMAKDSEGVWSVVVGPLSSDMWCYAYDVNGVKTLDPSNMHLRRDVLKVDNLVFAPGPAASLYTVNPVAHGTVSAVWYPSASLKTTRRMHVYTPPEYELGREHYPVLYLLHGAGGDEAEWLNSGRTAQIIDNLIAKHLAKPMIVVMPNGHASEEAAPDLMLYPNPAQSAPGYGGAAAMMVFPDSLTSDVVPFVEKNYRALAHRENRAVMGLSMGGAQAVYAGLSHLDQFAWVASLSGAFVIWQSGIGQSGPGSLAAPTPTGEAFRQVLPNLDSSVNSRLRLFYISCGLDDFLLPINRQFKAWLKDKDVHFVEVESPGYAHVWGYWRKGLAEVAPRLFQARGK